MYLYNPSCLKGWCYFINGAMLEWSVEGRIGGYIITGQSRRLFTSVAVTRVHSNFHCCIEEDSQWQSRHWSLSVPHHTVMDIMDSWTDFNDTYYDLYEPSGQIAIDQDQELPEACDWFIWNNIYLQHFERYQQNYRMKPQE